MRMVITTGDLEEGAHHVSEELYKKVALLIMSEMHPEVSLPTKRAADLCWTCPECEFTNLDVDDACQLCTTKRTSR